MRHRTWAVVALLAGALVAPLAIVRLGIYDVSATRMHTAPVLFALDQIKRWSVRTRARDLGIPDLLGAAGIERGQRHYQEHCVACHGAPGVARADLGKGATPLPPSLVETAREWTPAEIFWVVKHGIKGTGMPGWDYRMADEELWAITAFVAQLPWISPAEYRRRVGGAEPSGESAARAAAAVRLGDPARGASAIRQYACPVCHVIPGIVARDTAVGPSLAGLATRPYIAGVLVNTRENMIRWLLDPVAVDPLTAMPDLDLTPAHARDVAAYLGTLE